MGIDLHDRMAWVTGAAGDIGAACARRLAAAGARIVVIDIDGKRLQLVCAGMAGSIAHACDLASERDVSGMVARLLDDYGAPHIVVHCAGIISYRDGLEQIGHEDWDNVVDANLRSAFVLCKHAVPSMETNGWGRIVLLSSLAAEVGGIEVGAHYAASKAGLVGFARTLAKQVARSGITVNLVSPGIIATRPVLAQIGDHVADYIGRIPLGRLGTPEDVAGAVLFLCSELAAYTTGVTLDVNGGLYMG
jgi:3-oxoacyl-[acyl-carrier protein] reductase